MKEKERAKVVAVVRGGMPCRASYFQPGRFEEYGWCFLLCIRPFSISVSLSLLHGSILNTRIVVELFDSVEVPCEDDIKAKQADVKQVVPAVGMSSNCFIFVNLVLSIYFVMNQRTILIFYLKTKNCEKIFFYSWKLAS